MCCLLCTPTTQLADTRLRYLSCQLKGETTLHRAALGAPLLEVAHGRLGSLQCLLEALLPRGLCLSGLTISNCRLEPEQLACPSRLSQLRTLILSTCRQGMDHDSAEVAALLAQTPSLQSLRLSGDLQDLPAGAYLTGEHARSTGFVPALLCRVHIRAILLLCMQA